MNVQKEEIRNAVAKALNLHADRTFELAGFQRRPNSLRYELKREKCTQLVDVCIEYWPKDNPNAVAVIYPWLSVNIPDINSIAIEMTSGDDSLLSSIAATVHQPIEIVAPKGTGARWYTYQLDSVSSAIRDFDDFAKTWLFSFLNEYSTVEGVVALHRANDQRVLHDQDQILRVVAAMILVGKYEWANELLVKGFGRPAMRRRYASVFTYLDKFLGKGGQT